MGFLTTFTFRHHHLNWLFFIVRQMDQEQVAEQPLPDPPESTPANDGEEEEILSSEPMFTSPPAVYIEPEAPDPFLIDEEGDEARAAAERGEPARTDIVSARAQTNDRSVSEREKA